jgi:hypothetical protein
VCCQNALYVIANHKKIREQLINVEVTFQFAFLFLDGTPSYVKELANYFTNPTRIFNVIIMA